ncbi:MAG: hypothetical protein RMK84_05075 [Oscillochloridaceae bacterium]|nr:baseplate J/gp47 family protein [Chloroflexaceae bacterium]MDW8389475.1 hypothetical protein [Oscillochloridaceae bacterium]
MTTEPVAVVPVLPEDSADDVLEKLRGVEAGHVQLLVTEGAVVMRRAEVAEAIRKFGAKAGMALTVISSDPKVIQAARRAGLETLTVQHARVLPPGLDNRPPRSASPYATRPVPRAAPPGPDASDEEVLRAALEGDVAAAPPPPTVEPAPRRPEPAPRRPEPAPAARRRAWPIYALSALLLLLLAAIGAVLFLGGRVSVTVAPPARATTSAPFTGLPVPLLGPGAGVSSTAVLAEPIVSTVAVTTTGTVTEGTLTPVGSAEGPVTILNSSGQAILLPAGTEFVAIRSDGQEAPFISAADVLVPAATTADQGAQIVTTRGQAQVTVTARSPGSASNVEANTIRRITPPGGPTFNVSAGSLLVQHPPLTGGSEELVYIVKESDVQPLLAPALEQLDAEARRQLSGLAQARGLALDVSTINPRRSDLEQLQGFTQFVNPPLGAPADPANRRFELILQASYSALATPPEQPLNVQFGPVVTEQLRQAGLIQPGECRAPVITDWRWDGQTLFVDGSIEPDTVSPRCQGGIEPAVLEQVREAVRGKSYQEADAALRELAARGLIGDYRLPDVARMPRFGWQIGVEVGK